MLQSHAMFCVPLKDLAPIIHATRRRRKRARERARDMRAITRHVSSICIQEDLSGERGPLPWGMDARHRFLRPRQQRAAAASLTEGTASPRPNEDNEQPFQHTGISAIHKSALRFAPVMRIIPLGVSLRAVQLPERN